MKMIFSAKTVQISSAGSNRLSLSNGGGGIGGGGIGGGVGAGGGVGGYPILSMQNDMFGRLQNAKPCGSCGGTR